jgi:hypothetical protein
METVFQARVYQPLIHYPLPENANIVYIIQHAYKLSDEKSAKLRRSLAGLLRVEKKKTRIQVLRC